MYTNPWIDSYPDGATQDAGTVGGQIGLAGIIQRVELNVRERIEGLLGVDFDDDPLVLTTIGVSATILNKLLYSAEFDAGNSGAALTLNLDTNGPNQKFSFTSSGALTLTLRSHTTPSIVASPPAGSRGTLRIAPAPVGPGPFSITLSANVKTPGGGFPGVGFAVGPTVYGWYSDGTTIYLWQEGSTAFS